MATGTVRTKQHPEDTFVIALMALGKAPPKPEKDEAANGNWKNLNKVGEYIAHLSYIGQCEYHYMTVVRGPSYQMQSWTRQFLEWQNTSADAHKVADFYHRRPDLHACKGEQQ